MASTITKGLIGSPDIQFKDSGTTRATFTRPDSDGRTLTIFKVDGADIQFRTIAKSLDDLVDGGYDVPIKPSKIFGGVTNTNGHTVPNIADDTFALLAAAQTLTGKTLTTPTLTTPKVDTINEETAANGVSVDGCVIKDGGVEAVTDKSGGANLIVKVIDIGAWDMNATSGLNIAHGLSDVQKIRSVKVVVRDDAGTSMYELDKIDDATNAAAQGGINTITATNVSANRLTGGDFDAVTFDLVSFDIDNANAVNKGGGLVGIPITAHLFGVGNKTTLAGTTNYDATYTVISQTANEIVITATYVAETFVGGGAETATWGRGWATIWYTE